MSQWHPLHVRPKPQCAPPPVILGNSSSCFLMIIKHTSRCWAGNSSLHSLLWSSAANKGSGLRQKDPEKHGNAACIFTLWELQTELSFYIIKHMEVIFIVSLMCCFKQSASLFPVGGSINAFSQKQQFIIIMDL